jgi:hypothetical protein
MFGILYLQGVDCDGDNVLIGYPAVRISTHCGGHTPHNHGPSRVEVLAGRFKGRQFAPTFLEAGVEASASNQFMPLTATPNHMYFGS